jgi:Outer membrane protein beta-barrel domain
MKKIFLLLIVVFGYTFAQAQKAEVQKKKTDWSKVATQGRAADHFVLQIGYLIWTAKPDSINLDGFPRTINFHVMYDIPFKGDRRFSVGIGAGVGSDNQYFEKTNVQLYEQDQLTFATDTITEYKKFKLQSTYLEAPLELRFNTNPGDIDRSFKFGLGVKVGTLVNVHTRYRVESDAEGKGDYIRKVRDNRYFNNLRLGVTARMGWGHFSVFGTYQVNQFIKEGFGPDIRPLSVGLCLSGL